MNYSKKLPVIPSLSIVLTGCGDPISGDWTAVKGADNTFPYTLEQCFGGYDYSDYGYGYEYAYRSNQYCYSQTIDMWMTIDDELSGNFLTLMEMSYSYGEGYANEYEYSNLSELLVRKGEDKKYTLYSDNFTLDCTLIDNVTLKCESDQLNNDDNVDMDLSPVTFSKDI